MRRPSGWAAGSSSPNRAEASSLQSAASRQRGPGDDGLRVGDVMALHRGTPEGRLQPGQPAVGRRVANGAESVGPDRSGHQAPGDRGGRAARGAARAALEVPGVVRGPVDGGVAGAARAELVHVGYARDHCAGVAQRAVRPGFTGLQLHARHARRTDGLGAPGQRPLVLDHDGNAAQRPLRRLVEHPPRFLGEGRHDRVEVRVPLVDPRQAGVEELACVEIAGCDPRCLLS